ncbi:uncharacterized protein [Pyxicephalus adspersus]|uniref:uncharacterized protein isoform X1 n=1 Tax=Pyxicephalus adspersus TaxID=30357 RepID=UPI003B5C912A
MILHYRMCQTTYILLLFSGFLLGISQISVVKGSVTSSSTHVDVNSTVTTVTNSTSNYDLQSQDSSTKRGESLAATSKPTNESKLPAAHTSSEAPYSKSLEATSKPTNESKLPAAHTSSEAPYSKTLSATSEPTNESQVPVLYTSSEAPYSSEATPQPTKTPDNGILIGCLVCLFFIVIIISLVFIFKKKQKSSYSLNNNKSPEEAEIPLSNVKS